MLERARGALWNWLPTFVAVADTESVVRASRALGLTPQAVSRTVLLLEQQLGMTLFERHGRRLTLNAHGARLRDASRQALERVDAALVDLHADPFVGPIRVASLGVLTEHLVVPALIELKRAHPAAQPVHFNLRPQEANEELARGRVDLAFYYEELSAEGLVVHPLGSTTSAVYCGRTHPLFAKRKVGIADVLAHPFSVPALGDSGKVMDGWPAGLERQVGMQITLLRSNLQVCLSGALLTVLPDVTALEALRKGALRRFEVPELAPIPVFAARRASVPARGSALELITRVQQALARTNRELASRHTRGRKRTRARASRA